MPIYAYKCEACGFAKDVLQKVSDAPLTDCPSCGQAAFRKQVTAAGFQLKGSGWYVTDFRGNGSAPASGDKDKGGDGGTSKPAEAAKPTSGSESPAKPAEAAPAKSGSSSGSGSAT